MKPAGQLGSGMLQGEEDEDETTFNEIILPNKKRQFKILNVFVVIKKCVLRIYSSTLEEISSIYVAASLYGSVEDCFHPYQSHVSMLDLNPFPSLAGGHQQRADMKEEKKTPSYHRQGLMHRNVVANH